MGFATVAFDVLLQNGACQLEIACVRCVTHVRECRAQCFWIPAKYASERGCSVFSSSRQIGDQGTVIAEVKLSPLRLPRRIERFERFAGIARCKLDPGPRHGACKLTDGSVRGGAEVLFGFSEVPCLEFLQANEETCRAVLGFDTY